MRPLGSRRQVASLHSTAARCPGHLLSGPPARRHPVGLRTQGADILLTLAACVRTILSEPVGAQRGEEPGREKRGRRPSRGSDGPHGPAGHHAAAGEGFTLRCGGKIDFPGLVPARAKPLTQMV